MWICTVYCIIYLPCACKKIIKSAMPRIIEICGIKTKNLFFFFFFCIASTDCVTTSTARGAILHNMSWDEGSWCTSPLWCSSASCHLPCYQHIRKCDVFLNALFAFPSFLNLLVSLYLFQTAYRLGANVPLFKEPVALVKFGSFLLKSGKGHQKLGMLTFLNFFGSILLVNAESIQMVQFKRRMHAKAVMGDE